MHRRQLDSVVDSAVREQTRRVAELMPAPGHAPEHAAANASKVFPCFGRFASGELGGERVGRLGVAVFPALGEAYADEVAQADLPRREELRELVISGLAIGYAFFDRALAAGGNEISVDRPAERVWDAWTSRLNVGFLEAAGASPTTISALRSEGSRGFREMAKAAGLKGRGKLKRIGAFYAQAGGELRMIQSQPDLEIAPSDWTFDQYPSG